MFRHRCPRCTFGNRSETRAAYRRGMPARLLSELPGPELAERLSDRSVVVQPVGSVEQHGPHLPLQHRPGHRGRGVERGGRALRRRPRPVAAAAAGLLASPTSTPGRPARCGSSASTLLSVFMDIGRSLRMLPARRLVFLNGHGGNSSLLNVACRELRLAYGLMTFLAHPRTPPDQGGAADAEASELGMGIHGGIGETSMMLHLRPDLVAMDRAVRRVPEALAANRHVRFGGPVQLRVAGRRLRPRRPHRRPHRRDRRAGRRRLRAFGHRAGRGPGGGGGIRATPPPPVRSARRLNRSVHRALRRATGGVAAASGVDADASDRLGHLRSLEAGDDRPGLGDGGLYLREGRATPGDWPRRPTPR